MLVTGHVCAHELRGHCSEEDPEAALRALALAVKTSVFGAGIAAAPGAGVTVVARFTQPSHTPVAWLHDLV